MNTQLRAPYSTPPESWRLTFTSSAWLELSLPARKWPLMCRWHSCELGESSRRNHVWSSELVRLRISCPCPLRSRCLFEACRHLPAWFPEVALCEPPGSMSWNHNSNFCHLLLWTMLWSKHFAWSNTSVLTHCKVGVISFAIIITTPISGREACLTPHSQYMAGFQPCTHLIIRLLTSRSTILCHFTPPQITNCH